MSEIQQLIDAVVSFRDERDWQQFHNAKDLALAISVEAAELLEVFLWKKAEEGSDEQIQEELADLFLFALLLVHEKKLDIKQIILHKLKKNGEKYPVDKAWGNAKKYTDL